MDEKRELVFVIVDKKDLPELIAYLKKYDPYDKSINNSYEYFTSSSKFKGPFCLIYELKNHDIQWDFLYGLISYYEYEEYSHIKPVYIIFNSAAISFMKQLLDS